MWFDRIVVVLFLFFFKVFASCASFPCCSCSKKTTEAALEGLDGMQGAGFTWCTCAIWERARWKPSKERKRGDRESTTSTAARGKWHSSVSQNVWRYYAANVKPWHHVWEGSCRVKSQVPLKLLEIIIILIILIPCEDGSWDQRRIIYSSRCTCEMIRPLVVETRFDVTEKLVP